MTSEALSLTRSFSIALLALLEAMAPPAVSVGLLYGLSLLYGAEFRGFFVVLSILVGALSVLLPPQRARPPGTRQLLSPTWPLAGRVVVRWMVIVGILLAIGFVTKYIADFSRKVVVSWIVATPAVLILVTPVPAGAQAPADVRPGDGAPRCFRRLQRDQPLARATHRRERRAHGPQGGRILRRSQRRAAGRPGRTGAAARHVCRSWPPS